MRLRPAAGTLGIAGALAGARLWRRRRDELGLAGRPAGRPPPGFQPRPRPRSAAQPAQRAAALIRISAARAPSRRGRCLSRCGGRRRRSCHRSSYDSRSGRRRHRYYGRISNGRWLCREQQLTSEEIRWPRHRAICPPTPTARPLLSKREWNAFLHAAQSSPSSAAPPQLSQRDPRTSASSCVAGTSTGGRSMTAVAVDEACTRNLACTCAKGESTTGAGASSDIRCCFSAGG